MNSPSTPPAMWCSMSRAKLARSSFPSEVSGVTTGGITPVNRCSFELDACAAMLFLLLVCRGLFREGGRAAEERAGVVLGRRREAVFGGVHFLLPAPPHHPAPVRPAPPGRGAVGAGV